MSRLLLSDCFCAECLVLFLEKFWLLISHFFGGVVGLEEKGVASSLMDYYAHLMMKLAAERLDMETGWSSSCEMDMESLCLTFGIAMFWSRFWIYIFNIIIIIYPLDAFCTSSVWIRPIPPAVYSPDLWWGCCSFCQPCSVFIYRCRISTCPALTTPTADDYDYNGELGG